MKTKKIVITNIIILIIFFIVNLLFLEIEKNISESTSEILMLFPYILLFISLIIFNKPQFFLFKNKIKKILIRIPVILISFFVIYLTIFLFNWHIYYPVIGLP